MFGKHIAGAVRHMFAACLLMLAWGATAHAAPPLPDGIVPADGSTTAPLGTLLQWRTPPTSTTLTPVYVPKILIFNPVGTSLNVTESLNKYFTRYNSTETKSTDPNTIRTLLADKQVFLMPPQYYLGTSGYTTWSQLVTFGTTIGPILRQFVQGGGLVIVCDYNTADSTAKFMTNTGLMDVTWGAYATYPDLMLLPHPLTNGLADNFMSYDSGVRYSSVGDAQPLALVEGWYHPMFAIRQIGAGNVLLLGCQFYRPADQQCQILARAVETLSFSRGTNFTQYDVYFGSANPPATRLLDRSYETRVSAGTLQYATHYYWKVVAHDATGDTTGPLWTFRTCAEPAPLPPAVPSNPRPSDRIACVAPAPGLSWDPGTVPATYTVRLDTVNPPVAQLAAGLAQPSCAAPTLALNTTYYWQVTAHNAGGDSTGPVWSFTTQGLPAAPVSPAPADGATSQPLTTVLRWTLPTPAVTTATTPQVLIYSHPAQTPSTDNLLAAVRLHLTRFDVSYTSATTADALAADLADKHVFLIPDQTWDMTSLTALGTTFAPVLRQFVETGGLVVVADGINMLTPFLNNTGLMSVTQNVFYSGMRPTTLVSTHPITQDMPTTFVTKTYINIYSSVGDAQPLALDTTLSGPTVAIKSIGPGNVLLLGWNFYHYNSDMGRLLANAIDKLSLSRGTAAVTYDVWFGTANPPPTCLMQGSSTPQCSPGALAYATTYYWRVVVHNAAGATEGPVWSFQTPPLPPPAVPVNVQPANQAEILTRTPTLTWNGGAIPATFSIKLDTVNPPVAQVATGLTQTSYSPSTLAQTTTYYWQVIAHNATGDAAGAVWSFKTPTLPDPAANPRPADGATSVPVTTLLGWNAPVSTATLQVLAYKNSYYNADAILAAIRQDFTNFAVTETDTQSSATLAQQLAGKDLFLVPTAAMPSNVQSKLVAVLKPFVQNGGYVVAINPYAATLMQQAGLMDVTYDAYTASLTVLCPAGDLTRGVPASFSCTEPFPIGVGIYSLDSDTRKIAAQSGGYTAVGFKRLGSGGALIMGWRFYSANANYARILANTFQYAAAHPGTVNYDIYLGTSNPPTTKVGTTELRQFSPGVLSFDTTYYWRVVSRTSAGSVDGPVWSFHTGPLPPPAAPSAPRPEDRSTTDTLAPTLSWNGGAIIPVSSYTVKLDVVNPPVAQVATGLTRASYTPPAILPSRTYYWQVIAHNSAGSTAGPVWRFAAPSGPPAPHDPSPAHGATNVPVDTRLKWNTGDSTPVTNAKLLFYDVHCNRPAPLLAAIRLHNSNFTYGTFGSNEPSTSTLSWALSLSNVFVLPVQNQWTAAQTAAFGTNIGGILRDFVRNGGLVIVCDDDPVGGGAQFLANAGLMNVTADGSADEQFVKTVGNHVLLEGLSATFNARTATALYGNPGGATPLVVQGATSKPMVLTGNYGRGNVLLLGFSYDYYNSDMSVIPANAIRSLPTGGGDDYDVYFGTTNPPTTKIAASLNTTQCWPGALKYSTTYYWRIVARNRFDATQGPVWSFRTADPPAPATPSDPTPAYGTVGTSTTTTVSWNAGPYPATFSIKFGVTSPPTKLVASGLTAPSYNARLSINTTYYWQVTATNAQGTAVGPVWKFSTPLAPVAAYPPNGATKVPAGVPLQWNATTATCGTTVTAPVQILAFTGYCNATGPIYNNGLEIIREKFPKAAITATNTEDPATLAAQLSGKQIFILPEQRNWTASAMGTFGTNVGPVLVDFVRNGGVVIVMDLNPFNGSASFLSGAGLMSAWASNHFESLALGVTTSNVLTRGVASPFSPPVATALYSSVGDAQWLVSYAYLNRPAVAAKKLGNGTVVLLGWNYASYDVNMALLLTNPILYAAPSAPLTLYDLYFGTTNPPTTKVTSGTFATQFTPSGLAYNKTYYWRVVAHYPTGDMVGPVLSFTTAPPNRVPAGQWAPYR